MLGFDGTKVAWGHRFVSKESQESVLDSERNGWRTQGSFCRKLEEFAKDLFGFPFAATMSSGSAALDALLSFAEIGSGSEVLVPTFAPFPVPASATRVGAVPVFVRCDDELNMDVCFAEEAVLMSMSRGAKSVAAIPVEYGGFPISSLRFDEMFRKHSVFWILDASHSSCLGAETRFAPRAIVSLYASKMLGTAEGGLVLTRSKEEYDFCVAWRNQGVQDGMHRVFGSNGRMQDLAAASTLERFKEFDVLRDSRECNFLALRSRLTSSFPDWIFPGEPSGLAPLFFTILTSSAEDRVAAEQGLRSRGLSYRIFYDPPLCEHPVYASRAFFAENVAKDVERAKRVLNLPIHEDLSKSDFDAYRVALMESSIGKEGKEKS